MDVIVKESIQYDRYNLHDSQTYSKAVYSMLYLLPEKEQKETYDKFVYEFGRADFEINTAESLLNEFKYLKL